MPMLKRTETMKVTIQATVQVGVAKPISDQRGSADYRRHLVGVLTRRTLRTALARAGA